MVQLNTDGAFHGHPIMMDLTRFHHSLTENRLSDCQLIPCLLTSPSRTVRMHPSFDWIIHLLRTDLQNIAARQIKGVATNHRVMARPMITYLMAPYEGQGRTAHDMQKGRARRQ